MTKEELLDLIQSKLHDALYSGDLENGVAWLNEIAHEEFVNSYPLLNKAIGEIMHMELEDENINP
jgi:hypothetical protein